MQETYLSRCRERDIAVAPCWVVHILHALCNVEDYCARGPLALVSDSLGVPHHHICFVPLSMTRHHRDGHCRTRPRAGPIPLRLMPRPVARVPFKAAHWTELLETTLQKAVLAGQ